MRAGTAWAVDEPRPSPRDVGRRPRAWYANSRVSRPGRVITSTTFDPKTMPTIDSRRDRNETPTWEPRLLPANSVAALPGGDGHCGSAPPTGELGRDEPRHRVPGT